MFEDLLKHQIIIIEMKPFKTNTPEIIVFSATKMDFPIRQI